MPGLLPLDSRRSTAVQGDRDHQRHGGESKEDGAFSGGGSEREGVRREVQEVNTDQRCFHAVGDFAAAEEIPGAAAGFGPDVRL